MKNKKCCKNSSYNCKTNKTNLFVNRLQSRLKTCYNNTYLKFRILQVVAYQANLVLKVVVLIVVNYLTCNNKYYHRSLFLRLAQVPNNLYSKHNLLYYKVKRSNTKNRLPSTVNMQTQRILYSLCKHTFMPHA